MIQQITTHPCSIPRISHEPTDTDDGAINDNNSLSGTIEPLPMKQLLQPERGTLKKFIHHSSSTLDEDNNMKNEPSLHITTNPNAPIRPPNGSISDNIYINPSNDEIIHSLQHTISSKRMSTNLNPPDSSSPIQSRLTQHRQCLSPCVGCHSGHYSMQGVRNEMEDKVTLLTHPQFNELLSTQIHADKPTKQIIDLTNRSYYGVFDGHGGDVSAEYCHQHVHVNLMNDSNYPLDSCAALKYALLKTDNDFCNACRRINLSTSSGTTALTAYIECDLLIVGNIGDSRGVLCRSGRAVPVSSDHKPDRPDEQKRIEQLGGRVAATEDQIHNTYNQLQSTPTPSKNRSYVCMCMQQLHQQNKPLRVFPGGLSVSRTIGDISMKATRMVSNQPEMYVTHLTSNDTFLILACDGVWDVIDNQHAVNVVQKYLKSIADVDHAAKQLAKEAYRKGSTDNITVIIVMFQHHTDIKQQSHKFTSTHCDITG